MVLWLTPSLTLAGPAPMAECSKALSLTAHYLASSRLSPLPGYECWLGHVRKLPVFWG